MNASAAISSEAAQAPGPLTVEMVEKIVALDDTTLRNLRVTLGYYDLSCRIARAVGYENANWCTFAVWASRHAGEYVRGDVPVMDLLFKHVEQEENPDDKLILDAVIKHSEQNPASALGAQGLRNLRNRLRAQWLRRIEAKSYEGPASLHNMIALVFAAFGAATSHGNTRVFEDIARTFIPFLDLLEKAKSTEDKELAKYTRMMSSYPARLGGELELKKALEYYAQAKFESDPAQRSRLIFVANGFVGCHEQTRLQDEIQLALSAPIDIASAEVVRLWTQALWSHTPDSVINRFAQSRVGWMMDRLVRLTAVPTAAFAGSVLWGMFATHWMMALPLPDETLDLGADLPPLPDGSAFPEPLRDEALEKAGFGTFLHFVNFAYDNTLRGTAASDWTSYIQRMNTIANLFRSRQNRQSLFRPPFSPEQIAVLRTPRSYQIPLGEFSGKVPPFTAEGLRELRSYQRP